MTRVVAVRFGEFQKYELRVKDIDLSAATASDAQSWLDEQWTALECEAVRPSGKVLAFDKILGIARQAGEQRFAENGAWANAFARSVALLLERPVVLVDVAENRLG